MKWFRNNSKIRLRNKQIELTKRLMENLKLFWLSNFMISFVKLFKGSWKGPQGYI
jgi:hypothetical protein